MYFIPAIGVFAGWIIVMPATVLNLALRVDELTSSTDSTAYSLILSAGWVSLIIALLVMGHLSDSLLKKFNSRRPLIVFGIVGSATFGFLLSQSASTVWLAITWCAIQFPAAAIVSTSLALASEYTPPSSKGIASGLAGGAPVLALFIGTAATTLLSPSASNAFLLTSLLGAGFAIPLIFLAPRALTNIEEETKSQTELWDSSSTPKFWNRFLLAAFLLSCATSSANGFLLVYATKALNLSTEASGTLVTNMVLIASLASIVSGVISGRFANTKSRAIRSYGFAAIAVGATVGSLVLFPRQELVLIAGLIFGIGFGTANGLELTMYMRNHGNSADSGKILGQFTSATTAPYVLVPLFAALLLRTDSRAGITQLWLLGAAGAISAGVLVIKAARTKA